MTFNINGGTIDNASGAAITLTGNHPTNINADFTFGGTKVLNLGTSAVTLGTAAGTTRTLTTNGSATLTVGGVISNGTTANSITKTGIGTLAFTGASSYTGGTAIQNGTLKVGIANALPTGTTLTLGSTGNSAILDLGSGASSFNQQVAGLTTAGTAASQTITNSSSGTGTATLTVNNDAATSNADFTFGGIIQDGSTAKVALTKSGSKALTLSGSNTYTGPTNVTGGTLAVSGSISGTASVSVTSGTLLLSARGAVNPAAGVTLGDSVGSTSGGLTLANSLSSTSDTLASPAESFGNLTLSYNSTLDFGTGSGDWLNFAGVGSHITGATLTISNWSGAAYAAGDTSSDRLIFSGSDTSAFTNAYAQADVSFNGVSGYAAIQFDASHFEIVAIPEPSSTALLSSIGLLGLIGYRERRRVGRMVNGMVTPAAK